eukprot:c13329_g1_i2 orf=138-308(-)
MPTEIYQQFLHPIQLNAVSSVNTMFSASVCPFGLLMSASLKFCFWVLFLCEIASQT